MLDAPPGSSGVFLAGLAGALVPFEPFGIGSILLPHELAVPLTVPASGTARIAWTVPAAFTPGTVVFSQFLTVQPPWRWASSPSVLTVSH